jgi:hypothetical protein
MGFIEAHFHVIHSINLNLSLDRRLRDLSGLSGQNFRAVRVPRLIPSSFHFVESTMARAAQNSRQNLST